MMDEEENEIYPYETREGITTAMKVGSEILQIRPTKYSDLEEIAEKIRSYHQAKQRYDVVKEAYEEALQNLNDAKETISNIIISTRPSITKEAAVEERAKPPPEPIKIVPFRPTEQIQEGEKRKCASCGSTAGIVDEHGTFICAYGHKTPLEAPAISKTPEKEREKEEAIAKYADVYARHIKLPSKPLGEDKLLKEIAKQLKKLLPSKEKDLTEPVAKKIMETMIKQGELRIKEGQ